MEVELSLASSRLNEDTIDRLTRDLSRTLIEKTEISVETPRRPASEGAKGEPVTIGVLLLAFFTRGAAIALLNVLKSYVEREPTLKISLDKPDGTHIEIDAKNLRKDQNQMILENLLPENA